MAKRIDAARCDDPRLTHGSAHLLLAPPRLGDEVARPGQCRADRSAEAFREIDPRRVERLGVGSRGHAARDDGVHETGTVHVSDEVVTPSHTHDTLDSLE